MIAEVRITEAAWDAVVRHALDAWPDECCGLLIGDGAAIVEARPARNVSADRRRRFEVDPADHFNAIRAARASARIVCGAYHSHPESDPRPSETDLAEALEDEGFVHLIVRPGGRGELGRSAAVAAYRLITGNFVAVRLVRVA